MKIYDYNVTGELDQEVIPMVEYFNSVGLPTYMSCQGHNDTNMSMFWISFEKSVTIEDLVAFERKHTRWAGGFPCCGRFVVRVLANSNVLTPEGVELRCQYMAATVEAAKKDLARWKEDDTKTEEERRQMV